MISCLALYSEKKTNKFVYYVIFFYLCSLKINQGRLTVWLSYKVVIQNVIYQAITHA